MCCPSPREFGVDVCEGGGIGLFISPDPSIGPLARVAPRPRIVGFCPVGPRSFGLSFGELCVNTLLIALRGFPVLLELRSFKAGPVGGPLFTGDEGTGPCDVRLGPEPRGPLGGCGTLVWMGGPPAALIWILSSLLGCIPPDWDAAGPEGAVGVGGWDCV